MLEVRVISPKNDEILFIGVYYAWFHANFVAAIAGFNTVVVATWNIWALRENVKDGDYNILPGSFTTGKQTKHPHLLFISLKAVWCMALNPVAKNIAPKGVGYWLNNNTVNPVLTF